jgi:hypothetical protein
MYFVFLEGILGTCGVERFSFCSWGTRKALLSIRRPSLATVSDRDQSYLYPGQGAYNLYRTGTST